MHKVATALYAVSILRGINKSGAARKPAPARTRFKDLTEDEIEASVRGYLDELHPATVGGSALRWGLTGAGLGALSASHGAARTEKKLQWERSSSKAPSMGAVAITGGLLGGLSSAGLGALKTWFTRSQMQRAIRSEIRRMIQETPNAYTEN